VIVKTFQKSGIGTVPRFSKNINLGELMITTDINTIKSRILMDLIVSFFAKLCF
jgi:hypothetical protein